MRKVDVIKSGGLGGSSDFTLLAPIKAGIIESLESVTYKTRIKLVVETLHGARVNSHEQSIARLLSDSVERVGVIHSVRVAVLEPENQVFLAVTFDGRWESYIRVLWDKDSDAAPLALTEKLQFKADGFSNIVTGGKAEIRLVKSRMLCV